MEQLERVVHAPGLPAPITKEAIIQVVAATLAPVIPLALTMMPLEQLLKTLLGVLF